MEKSPMKKGPGHFLVRNTGEVVPLIPIDELPLDVEVIGVPRSLDLTDTVGMLNLGLVKGTGHVYSITLKKEDTEKKKRNEERKREREREKEKEGLAVSKTSTPSKVETPPKTLLGGLATSRHRPTSTSTSSNSMQTCKHWCAHGICKWGQQCRYLHIMPMTLSGLREAGLNDWPTWYRNLTPGYFHDSAVLAHTHSYGHSHSHVRRGDCCAHHHHHHHRLASGTSTGVNHIRRAQLSQVKDDERAGLETLQRLSTYAGPVPSPLSALEKEKEKEKEKENEKIEDEQIRKMLKKKDVKVLVERAAGRDARDWIDDGSSESSGSEGEVVKKNVGAGMAEKEDGIGQRKKSDEKKVTKLVDV